MQTEFKQVTIALLTSFLEEYDVKFPKDSTDEELAVLCVGSLVKKITREYGVEIERVNDEEFRTCALFVYVLSERMATIFAVNVEQLAMLAYSITFVEHQDSDRLLIKYKDLAHCYNYFRQKNPEPLQNIATVLIRCIVEPNNTKSFFAATRIFKLLVDSLAEEPSASEFPAVIDERQKKALEKQVFWLVIVCFMAFIMIVSLAFVLLG